MNMTKLHVSLNAQRSDAFTLAPENCTLVTDPAHPLYDPRVHDEPDEAMVRNIMVYGIIEPIIVRKNGDKVEVVAGRGRVKCALEANRRLTAEGKQPIRVPAMLRRGQDAEMYGVLISENECRREDNPLLKAEKAQRLINMGKTVEEVAIAFGVKRQSVDAWLALGDVDQSVLDAVEQGEISATAASHLSKMARGEQVEAFEAMKAEGGKVTVGRVKEAVRKKSAPSEQPKSKMLSRQAIEEHYKWLSETSIEVNAEFYRGFKNALCLVLGLGCTWPPYKSGRKDDAPEQQNKWPSTDSDGWTDVFAYGEQEPLRLPPGAPLVEYQAANKAGWCEDCPLASTAHVMIATRERNTYAKLCPLPLLQRGHLDLDPQVRDLGDIDDNYRAKIVTKIRTLKKLPEAETA
jgi:ParB family chromosome partitioning protein